MSTVVDSAPAVAAPATAIGALPSPAGPVDPDTPAHMPPGLGVPATLQGLRFARRPMSFALAAQRRFGDVWQLRVPTRAEAFTVTCHPDHVRSLLTADPADAPSLTGESPLRPILGPNSVLTSVGARHLRQRKLLLPPFHGEAVQRYVAMIADVAEQEIDRWPVSEPFALAPRMQAVTLEVIMRGVFGVGAGSVTTDAERRMRQALRRMLAASMSPLYLLVEMRNARHAEPKGMLAAVMAMVDRQMYAVIRERRAAGDGSRRADVLSLLLAATDEDGRPLTDNELRDELMSLVLAGHETTANSLAWTFERLLRDPARLRAAARPRPRQRRCRRRGVRRGHHPRGDAQPSGDPDDRADGAAAVALRRLHRPRAHPGGRQHRRAASPPRCLSRSSRVSTPSDSFRQSPAPTPGSPSAAGSADASGRRWRWPSSEWCWRRSPAAPTSLRLTSRPSARACAT